MKNGSDIPEHEKWKAGMRQEIIDDQGEGKLAAIEFMRKSLERYGHPNLTFKISDIAQEGNSYFFIFIDKRNGYHAKHE